MSIFASIVINDSRKLSQFDAERIAVQVAEQITKSKTAAAAIGIGIDRINVLKRTACSADAQLVRFVTCSR
jgi:hypothetical protein